MAPAERQPSLSLPFSFYAPFEVLSIIIFYYILINVEEGPWSVFLTVHVPNETTKKVTMFF